MRLENLAQAQDMHVDGAIAEERVDAPDRVEDLFTVEDLARIFDEQAQQSELGPGQVDRRIADEDFMGPRIQADRSGLTDARPVRSGSAAGVPSVSENQIACVAVASHAAVSLSTNGVRVSRTLS